MVAIFPAILSEFKQRREHLNATDFALKTAVVYEHLNVCF